MASTPMEIEADGTREASVTIVDRSPFGAHTTCELDDFFCQRD
ncbi:hypothetical protein [uncultured Roseobacter sp.]|nr:hypothetical protein [uncultured Roseobacter sp.]